VRTRDTTDDFGGSSITVYYKEIEGYSGRYERTSINISTAEGYGRITDEKRTKYKPNPRLTFTFGRDYISREERQ
jgi:hypothetical protein